MTTYVLTYNPAKWDWDPKDRAATVRRTSRGQTSAGSWSTGNRKSGIGRGDTAVLLQQGTGDRGLIGRGTFTRAIYQDDHWDGSGRQVNYADVRWDVMLDDADLIPLAVVEAAVRTVRWNNIMASGIVVPAPGDDALARLWPDGSLLTGRKTTTRKAAAANSLGPSRRVQGRQNDPARRKAVEEHAQALLEAKYVRDGWSVTDTHVRNPYDAIAKKRKQTRYLEAKGTETNGRSVLVTAGEVRWAEKYPGECVLGVVSGIKFNSDGQLDETSGSLTEYTWDPSTGLLKPQTFTWTPPAQ